LLSLTWMRWVNDWPCWRATFNRWVNGKGDVAFDLAPENRSTEGVSSPKRIATAQGLRVADGSLGSPRNGVENQENRWPQL